MSYIYMFINKNIESFMHNFDFDSGLTYLTA